MKEARLGVEIIEKELQKVAFNDKTYLLHDSSSIDIKRKKALSFCLLTTNTSLPTSIVAMFCKLLTTAKHLLTTVFSFLLSYKMAGRWVIENDFDTPKHRRQHVLLLITTPQLICLRLKKKPVCNLFHSITNGKNAEVIEFHTTFG